MAIKVLTSIPRLRVRLQSCILACLLAVGGAVPATSAQVPQSAPQAVYLNPIQLSDLVAPIALYPDDLLGIVLAAATQPLQVLDAWRYLETVKAIPTQEPDPAWDDAVVALLNYPDVLERMNRDIEWTLRLGDAMLVQQADVIAAVGEFRARAQAAGNLTTNAQQVVSSTGNAIQIAPANPSLIYVPYYEPARVLVYQSAPVVYYYPRPCPVYHYPYAGGYPGGFANFWGVGSVFSIGWGSRNVRIRDHGHFRHHAHAPRRPGHFHRDSRDGDGRHGDGGDHRDGRDYRQSRDRDGRDGRQIYNRDGRDSRERDWRPRERTRVANTPDRVRPGAEQPRQAGPAINPRDTRSAGLAANYRDGRSAWRPAGDGTRTADAEPRAERAPRTDRARGLIPVRPLAAAPLSGARPASIAPRDVTPAMRAIQAGDALDARAPTARQAWRQATPRAPAPQAVREALQRNGANRPAQAQAFPRRDMSNRENAARSVRPAPAAVSAAPRYQAAFRQRFDDPGATARPALSPQAMRDTARREAAARTQQSMAPREAYADRRAATGGAPRTRSADSNRSARAAGGPGRSGYAGRGQRDDMR